MTKGVWVTQTPPPLVSSLVTVFLRGKRCRTEITIFITYDFYCHHRIPTSLVLNKIEINKYIMGACIMIA